MAHIVELHDAHKAIVLIEHREEVTTRVGDDRSEASQLHIGRSRLEVLFDDILGTHEREDGLVLVVSEQFTLLGQTHGVDAVRLEHTDGKERECRRNHQREKEVITTREFGDEEDTRERSVHHTTHKACHTEEGKIILGQVYADAHSVEEMREHKSRDTAQEEAGCKDTATSAPRIGCRGGKDLEEQHESEVYEQHTRVTIEERVVHRRSPLGIGAAIKQKFDGLVTLTIERGEEENEQAKCYATNNELHVRVLETAEEIFQLVHRLGEIERHEATNDT